MNNTIRDYVAHHFEEALQSGCITVCYEPVLRALTNKICSFEALARWHDPERGEILPRDFIPVLEETNKIHLLDHFIAKTAIQALHTRQQQDLPIVPVVINLSRRDFYLTAPAGVLNQLTEKYQLPHIYLQVEITETAFIDDEAILTESIQKLRANGYTVTLDNFGEGHSSLAALQRCSIDEISLDKVFFENFTESSCLLLTSILLMAKTLSIHTAAEGVQTEEQAEFLRRIGCEKIQGPVCRPHVTPVDQLQILQQAQAPYFESLLEQQVFQQAGLTNLVTDAPIALFVDDEKKLQLLTANTSYEKELQLCDIDSIQEANRQLRELPQPIAARLHTMAHEAIRSHRVEGELFVQNGRYFQFHLRNLAGTNGFYIHRAELHCLPQAKDEDLSEQYDQAVRHLMQFYHDIYLIDTRQNCIQVLSAKVSTRKAGSHMHGIMAAFMNFANLHIHPDDHTRFLHYIHRLISVSSNEIDTTRFDLFRVKMPNSSYHWKNFSLTSFRYKDRLCQLLCLRDVEEERNYHKLQRKLYLIDEETDFYNYRGMILASVEFADNLRLSRVNYTGAMLVIPEFASIAKLYRPSVRRAVLRRICAVIRKNMPASVVAAHTGRATFVLFLKNQSVGTMRRFIEQIRTDLTTITEVDGFACHFSMHYALESGTEARTSDEFLKILSSRCLDYLPSYGVTGMIGDQVPFDIEKFDHINRLIYIADAETYDLLYVNPCLLHYRHLPVDYQYAGQKCYQLFNGTSSPCTSCPKDNLRRDRFHFRTFHSLRNSRDYHIWSTLVSWNNHSCIFTNALDVERMMDVHDADKLTEQFNVSVNDITGIAIQEEDPNVGIQRMMEKLGRTLSATHIILMEEESDGFHLSCTYEWHAEDCAPLRQCLQHTTVLENKPFYDAFHRSSVLLIDNAAAYQECHPELQRIPQRILKRYAIGQLMIEHPSFSYIAIIDPTKEGFAAIAKPLHTILRVTSIMMRNRNNIQKLHEISTIDQLTGIGNRRALSNFIDKCLQPGTMYAVIFIDVNKLKKMNDTFGHARGDLLIQTIAYVLSNVAGKNHVFRLGDDEFLVLMPCSNDEEAITIIDRMEQSMATHRCSAAIGYVLCLAPFHDLDGLIHQADEKMYSDKKRKHMRRDDD